MACLFVLLAPALIPMKDSYRDLYVYGVPPVEIYQSGQARIRLVGVA